MQYAYFNELPQKALFSRNGNQWRKQSTRTAYLPEYTRWFYFAQRELCIVGEYSRLSEDYFNQ